MIRFFIGKNANIWVVAMIGEGIAPTAKLQGERINAQLIINEQTVVRYNQKNDRLFIKKKS